jgi:hypothetical protein
VGDAPYAGRVVRDRLPALRSAMRRVLGFVRARPWAAGRWRFGATVGPAGADCAALLGPVAASHNSLRSLRSLRSDKCDESVHEARYARPPQTLRCSPWHRRATGQPPTAAQMALPHFERERIEAGFEPAPIRARRLGGAAEPQARSLRFGLPLQQQQSVHCKGVAGRRAQRLCGAEQRRVRGGARSAPRELTRRVCLSAANAVRAASYAARHEPEQRTEVSPYVGLTAATKRSPLPGHAFALSVQTGK